MATPAGSSTTTRSGLHLRSLPKALTMTERTTSLPPATLLDGIAVKEPEVTGRLIERDGARWYRIDGLERMEPFLTTVVSDSDLWLFASSAGPLTAGRGDADHAMLPYETDDRLHRAVERSGPVTLLVRMSDGGREVWQPFARRPDAGCTRAIEKHVLGTALTLEEVNRAWGLRFRATWTPSRSYGWIRTVELTDLAGRVSDLEVLDGLLDVLPAGVDAGTQQSTSNLVDSYKRSETGRWGTLALYALESLITDRAEPAESLAATVVWSGGLDGAEVHLDERVVEDVRRGVRRAAVELLTGRRGAYLLHGLVAVPSGGSASWFLALDTGLGHAALHDRVEVAADASARQLVEDDVRLGIRRVETLLAGADGLQWTADPVADAHHLSNVLFNAMRGGVFPHGDRIPVTDLVDFLRCRNVEVHGRHEQQLRASGEWIALDALHDLAEGSGDDDLVRLVLEYLPLTFSRRHGDPSRPWNRFTIKVTADDGAELLYHEGNWRDIFQNWEALLRSYPRYLPHVVAKFVDASTVDGHNPYRISRDGIDWEVPDPEDPWSNLGYWGDHQIVYLLRLLEGWEGTDPAGLRAWLDRPIFTYADVPYRIAGHDAMLADPRATITYDDDRARRVAARVDRLGADGRLVEADGELVRVTMIEKLLVPALAKLSSYVAGGGIWMNTQRPEWNDANNALAGYGLSMVTLYHLERYLGFLAKIMASGPATPVVLSRQVAAWLAEVTAALVAHDPQGAVGDAILRRQLLDDLGTAGETYRELVNGGFDREVVEVEAATVQELLGAALPHLRASIRAARRADGLYHAYNLVSFPAPDTAEVARLPVMLEGQVAVLGTGELDAPQAAALVEALFDSALYRADQRTFMLYPATARPSFLDRNQVPAETLQDHPDLQTLAGGPHRILEVDGDGGLHFRADLTNAAALTRALDIAGVDDEMRAVVAEIYEQQFHHHAFTGRSGGMHGYEGIGSVYWHMVSKLLLAVQERAFAAAVEGTEPTVVERLASGYRRIRDGLGFRKEPAEFGAFPTDCYSHTPAHAGAQQPGMTGQVKEEVLTRLGELGFVLVDGVLAYRGPLLPADELWWTPHGQAPQYRLTVCATPVRVVRGDADEVRIERADGAVTERAGRALTPEESAELFDRRGTITAVEIRTVQEGDR
jgi:hypothetical protein